MAWTQGNANMHTTNDYITVVSGLPRSGTSMMMAMLAAGGLPLLVDQQRPADASNPNGYFEYAPAKAFDRHAPWLPDARGKGVKIISFLLLNAPPEYRYKVLFMVRPLPEVLASQRAMLRDSGIPAGPEEELEAIYETHLRQMEAWVTAQPNIQPLFIPYHDVLDNAMPAARRIANFLACDLDASAMAAAVQPALSRQRASGGGPGAGA